MLVLDFPDPEQHGRALSEELDSHHATIDVHHFPDGESRLRLPENVPEHVVLCRSLHQPNQKLVELLLAADAAREMGARQITLVAPYLCYMRQDAAFRPGEVVSQRLMGRFLARLADTLITVDPHLHRVSALSEVIPNEHAVALSAAPAMGEFLARHPSEPLLVGPDHESQQWVSTAAEVAGLEYVVAAKTRHGDRTVDISLPEAEYKNRHVVLVDDLASTGRTLAVASTALHDAGAERVDVLVSHPLFFDDAMDTLAQAGVKEVWSSDSVAHPTNAFALAPFLADAIRYCGERP